MQLSIISQILAENDYVQQVVAGQGPSSLVAAHRRLNKLANQLKRYNPSKTSYCLVCTILANSAQNQLNQLRYLYNRAGWDKHSRTQYYLSFEQLQYQINLATSLLS
ncbi:hypothetical protein [Spirosoma sp. KNUC1025]|uniref:hypothetical protein n=1 Tax=Spirosoma sp. KNUC1025 TaxID=2894082 RepID=UPI003864DDF6|nr:hypothetical protein LN737_00100 [Spirosoma sp. KNUC1025]